MNLPRVIRHRLSQIALFAADQLDEPILAEEPATEMAPAASEPADHLRRALVALQSRDKTRPDPRLFGELRLMLNQLESGRLPRQLSSELVATPRFIEAPKKPQRRSMRGLLGRGARALSKMARPD